MQKKYIQLVPWLLVVLMILFIFSNSLVPATGSKELSSGFTMTIYTLLEQFQLSIDFELLHHLIRKSAHFLEYALLGTFICWANSIKPLLPNKVFPLFCFLLIPLIDETIQLFVPGRSSEFGDMLIDASGMFVGYLFTTLLLNYFVKKLNSRKRNS